MMFWIPVRCTLGALILALSLCSLTLFAQDEDPVYSGPQVGESVNSFDVQPLFPHGESATQPLQWSGENRLDTVVIVHKITRPGFGLLRTITRYVETLNEAARLRVVFLSADVQATQRWAQGARNALLDSAEYWVSVDGVEGPGSLGLNRHVELTVLIVEKTQVVANFALIQPSDSVDAPKVVEAIAKALGRTPPDVREIETWRGPAMARNARAPARPAAAGDEVDLRRLVGPVIQLDASDEAVEAAGLRVEAEAEKNQAFRDRLGQACQDIMKSGSIEKYGTPRAQQFLREWAEKYGGR